MAPTALRFIDPALIKPSPMNPRKVFRNIDSLAKSLAATGMLQPLTVRMVDAGDEDEYELVCGERRWRAALHANLETVPAIVRALSDVEVLDLQMTENDQRSDVTPMEQARGYQALIHRGSDVAAIAARIGRDASYVKLRLQLATLNEQFQKWLDEEKILLGHGLLIARLNESQQAQLIKNHLFQTIDTEYWSMPTVHRVRESIEELFHLGLKSAPFPTDLDNLIAGVPPCGGCSNRAGNSPELWPDIKSGDTCTDSACYRSKEKAFVELQVRKAAEKAPDTVRVSVNNHADKKGVLGYTSYEIVPAKEAKKAKAGTLTTAVITDQDWDKKYKPGQVVQVRVKPKRKESGGQSRYDYEANRKKRAEAQAICLKARTEIAIAIAEAVKPPAVTEYFAAFLADWLSEIESSLDEPMKRCPSLNIDLSKAGLEDMVIWFVRALPFSLIDHWPTEIPEDLKKLAKHRGVDAAAIFKKVKADSKSAQAKPAGKKSKPAKSDAAPAEPEAATGGEPDAVPIAAAMGKKPGKKSKNKKGAKKR